MTMCAAGQVTEAGPPGQVGRERFGRSRRPQEVPDTWPDPRARRNILCFGLLLALLVVLVLLNIAVGSVTVPLIEIPQILLAQHGDPTDVSIVWEIRLPRLLAAMILGGGLALAGFLLQTFFHNPIAGPFVLGISSGAKLTVAIVTVFAFGAGRALSPVAMIGAAFAGALATMGLVMALATKVERMSMLIVAGVMVGYICSAITDFIVTFADDSSIVKLHNWSQGSFSGIAWSDVKVMSVVIFAASALVFWLAKPIGAYQLGEHYAQNMGVDIRSFRLALVLLSSLLAACVTAFAGPVSFVGIAVPHLIRWLFHTARPLVVIPACFLGGAVFCLGCDLLARTAFAPTEINISSMTAVFGAPVVLAVMLRRRRDGAVS